MTETKTGTAESVRKIDEWVAKEVRFATVRREIALKLGEASIASVEIARNPKTNETLSLDHSGRFKAGFYMLATGENHLDILEASDPIRDFAEMTDEKLLNFNNDPRN